MNLLRGGTLAAVWAPGSGPWAFDVRPGTVDAAAIRESWVEDVYGIDRTPWAAATDGPGTGRRPVMIDVGAHIGAVAARAALAGAFVVAFEPDAENVARCQAHTAGLTVDVMPLAVNGGGGRVPLTPIGATGMVRIADPDETALTDVVDAWTLDDAVAYGLRVGHTTRIRLLKIDVEGAEWIILDGADDDTIERCDLIAVETHPVETSGTFGVIAARLAETHTVQIVGSPFLGGYLTARRYGF